jgi:hypothetical protein
VVPSNICHRQTPGINPTNPGPGNLYHLRIQHTTGEDGLVGLILQYAVIAALISNSVKMEAWYKPIFGTAPDKHSGWLIFREKSASVGLLVAIAHDQTAGEVKIFWGRQIPGESEPTFDGVEILSGVTPGDVVGFRAWCKDIDPDQTQFYVQWYNGSAWETVANYLIGGAYGVTGNYRLVCQGDPAMDETDEDWFDDFEFAEDDPPEVPP